MAMESEVLKPVESSMFTRAGYDEANWSLLFEFKGTGEVRSYLNVTPEVADEALSAPSLGKWFHANIRGRDDWKYDVLVPGKQAEPKAKTKPLPDDGFLTEEDLAFLDKPAPSSVQGETLPPFDPPDMLDDSVQVETALQTLPQGEVLGSWQPPRDAKEAITLLSEREREINALVAFNSQKAQMAMLVTVTDQTSHEAAAGTLKELVDRKDKTIALLDPFRALIYASYKVAGERKDAAVNPIATAEQHIKRQMLAWQQAEERKRQEVIAAERRRAEEEARRRQEEETQRLTLAEMNDRIEQGDDKGAEQLLFTPIEAPRQVAQPEYIPPSYSKPSGMSTTTKWKVAEEDIESDEDYLKSIIVLLRAVKDGSYDIETAATHLKWDLPKVNKLASSLMSAFKVPGLRAAPESSLSVRRGKKK